MTFEKIPCRWCGMTFENLTDRTAHEACHTDPMPQQAPVQTLEDFCDAYQKANW